MSNPAVITLADASQKIGKIKRFVIEDNIGESIHLHVDNMRVDFTINEFLEFSELIRQSLKQMEILGNKYNLDVFDSHFMKECAFILPNILKIEVEDVKISDLSCIVYKSIAKRLKFIRKMPVFSTPAYKYLCGDKKAFYQYEQYNYISINNEKRLTNLAESVKNHGYPYKDQYVIVFEGQNIIRDGQHRAAVLAHQFGLDSKIKIMRFYFSSPKSYKINVMKYNIRACVIYTLKRLYKTFRKYI